MILVVGSINMDVCLRVGHIPMPGETVLSLGFAKNPGGKGSNQAVAAAKLGADVMMLGCVGADENGEQMLNSLRSAGVNTDYILRKEGTPTSTAYIYIADSGENCIVVDSSANSMVTPEYLLAHEDLFQKADYCVMQLEIPLDAVRTAKKLCEKYQVKVVFNPSPMNEAAKELADGCYCIIPNEAEAGVLYGKDFETISDADWQAFMKAKHLEKMIITLGKDGCRFYNGGKEPLSCPSKKVKAADTTGAGDTFLGAFVTADSEKMEPMQALRFANTASGIEVTRPGAQKSMPLREEVDTAL